MAEISRIANVQISLQTTPIDEESFSTMIIVGPHVVSTARVSSYTAASQLIDDGFSESDPVYKAAADAFSQIPKPAVVKIGRRQVDEVVLALKSVKAQGVYKFTVATVNAVTGGNDTFEISYSAPSSEATASSILTGLKSDAETKLSGKFIATVTDETLKIEIVNTGDAFSVELGALMQISSLTAPTETVAESMAAIKRSDADWYGICFTSKIQADILAMADWAEANGKLYGTSISEIGAKNSEFANDTGSKLKEGNYFRTFWFYHANAENDFPEAALMARCFAVDPGGETWANKKLSGVTTDKLKETEYLAVTGKNGNTFEPFRNVAITQNGKVAAGEWIDVIRFRDWLQEDMQVRIFNKLINKDKIPYTDGGIAIIENEINASLKLGQRRGGIAPTEYDEDGNENPGFIISVPLNYDISANDKANRVLNDVKFTARLAGAIHVINVYGSLTYENLA